MLNFLLSQMGRYIVVGTLVLALTGGIVYKIRSDAIAAVEARALADALRRTQNAVRAGDSVDISPDGLLKSDGHRRD